MESRPSKILFWTDVIASSEILEKYKTTIDKIRAGEYSAADLDLKVNTYPKIYSVKTNGKHRLLLTPIKIEINGKKENFVYVAEELLDHKYENSHVMQDGGESTIETNKAQKIIGDYLDNLKQNHDVVNTNANINHNGKSSYSIEYLAAAYLDEKWIELNDTQQMVLKQPIPFICHGTPGSGKSTLSLALIAKGIDDGHTSIVYITQSVPLKNAIQDNWNDSPYSKNLSPEINVRFATYIDLLLEDNQNHSIVDDSHCLKWIDDNFSFKSNKNKNKKKSKANNNVFPEDFDCSQSVYDEFRTASACTEQQYHNLGERQCLLFGYPDAKQKVWNALTKYKKYLTDRNCIHPAFTAIAKGITLPFTILDEAQDFSTLQLASLCEQVANNNICIFYDSDQSIIDKISKEDFLKFWFYTQRNLSIEALKLSSLCYRSLNEIVNAGNHLLRLRLMINGGRVNTDQKTEIENNPLDTRIGNVSWPAYFDPKSKNLKNAEIGTNLIAQLKEQAKSAQCIIITTEEHIEEAMELFGTGAVFTVKDIKGLQRKKVIIYKLFDDPKNRNFLTEVNNRLPQLLEDKVNTNRTKIRGAKSNPFIMNIYTAIMRATDEVIIVQEELSYIKNVKKYMLREFSQKFDKKKPIEHTSAADWDELTDKLARQDCKKQVENIQRKRPVKSSTALIQKKSTATAKSNSVSTQNHSVSKPITIPQKQINATNAPVETSHSLVSATGFPLAYNPDKIGETAMGYVNDLFFSQNFEKDVENLLNYPTALKFLFGIKFRKVDPTNQKTFKMSDDNAGLNKYFCEDLPDGKLRLCRLGANGNLTVEDKLKEEALDGLEIETLYTHIYNDPIRSKIFLDALCKQSLKFPGIENIFFIVPDNPTMMDMSVLIQKKEAIHQGIPYQITLSELKAKDILFGNFEINLRSMIYLAMIRDHAPFINLLMDKKIIHKDCEFSREILLQLASYSNSDEVTKLLLGYDNIEFNFKKPPYETPLFLAASEGNTKAIEIMIKNGEDINGNDKKNNIRTPIMAAIQNNYLEVVELLASHNAKLPTIIVSSKSDEISKSLNEDKSGRFLLQFCKAMNTTLIEYVKSIYGIPDLSHAMDFLENKLKLKNASTQNNTNVLFRASDLREIASTMNNSNNYSNRGKK